MRSLFVILVVVLIECCTQKAEAPLPYSTTYCNDMQDDSVEVWWGSNCTLDHYGACRGLKLPQRVGHVNTSHFICMLGYTERPQWSEEFTWPSGH